MTARDDAESRVAEASQLLEEDKPEAAQLLLEALLTDDPENAKARRVLGFTYLQLDRTSDAVEVFEGLIDDSELQAVPSLDLAKALRQAGELDRCVTLLRDLLNKAPTLSPGWFQLGDALVERHEYGAALEAFRSASANDPFQVQINQCMRSIQENDLDKVHRILNHILELDPLHVEALAGMQVLAFAEENWKEAERLFELIKNRTHYWPKLLLGQSQLFLATNRALEAKQTLTTLLEIVPDMLMAWNMLGTANELMMENDEAIDAFEESLKLEPNQPRALVSIGNIQRVMGHRTESIDTFRKALAFHGMNGEAYWGLSNLKDYEFSDEDVAAMQSSLDQESASLHHASPLFFALGKAYEDRGKYPAAFALYQRGNAIQKNFSPFDKELFSNEIERIIEAFDLVPDSAFEDQGSDLSADTPIFIVGMPRTGSTLVEQILACHSRIDATMELPFIEQYVSEINDLAETLGPYPESVASIDASYFQLLAKHYLNAASIYRKGAPFFTDKMPNNFVHIGLIKLMFPQAKFIDINRHPMDTCLSCYKQRFAAGQAFTYAINDLGYYYRGYRYLMRYWSSRFPDSVYTVVYENLVTEPESEIRRLVDFLGLDMESSCLHPESLIREIRTPSSEQVRSPITSGRIGFWRNFESDLEPLRQFLHQEIEDFERQTSP